MTNKREFDTSSISRRYKIKAVVNKLIIQEIRKGNGDCIYRRLKLTSLLTNFTIEYHFSLPTSLNPKNPWRVFIQVIQTFRICDRPQQQEFLTRLVAILAKQSLQIGTVFPQREKIQPTKNLTISHLIKIRLQQA